MKQDMLSAISKGKPVKRLASSVTVLAKLQSATPSIGFSATHKVTIVDEYLIKIHPKNPATFTTTPIRSFDLDGTIIETKSGSKFSRGPHDWRWFNDKVIPTLLQAETPIVIFTNQGAVVAQKTAKSYLNFTAKMKLILEEMEKLGVDMTKVWIYASPKKSTKYKGLFSEQFAQMRKPETGTVTVFEREVSKLDKGQSVFVGDAAGRKGDFSDSDKRFAQNSGLPFKTPEEYFV